MKFFPFLFVILSLSASTIAFTISPPLLTVDFVPGVEQIHEIRVNNRDGTPIELKVDVYDFQLSSDILREELKGAVTVTPNVLMFASGETTKSVTLLVHFPSSLSASGPHELRIAVTEVPKNGGMVGAQASNVMRLLINIPAEYVVAREFPALPLPQVAAQPQPEQVSTPPPGYLKFAKPTEPEPIAEGPAVQIPAPNRKRNLALLISIVVLAAIGLAVYYSPMLMTELGNKASVLC